VAGALSVLARIELLRGQAAAALQASERAIEQLTAHRLFENVAMMRITHIECLLACGREEDARRAVANAHQWLQARVGKIADPALRQAMSAKVPENARILELARAWLGGR
jgi:hypothetical protein